MNWKFWKYAMAFVIVFGMFYGFANGDYSSGFGCLVAIIIVALIIFYFKGRKSQCPECKKLYAMKKAGQTLVNQQSISMNVRNDVRDRDGKVTGSYDQMIPGTRNVYECKYVCKHCGHIETTKETKDIPNV